MALGITAKGVGVVVYNCVLGGNMPLSREEVEHIALLARVGMTEQDLETFGGQLSHILEQFRVLEEVDTEGVPPTSHTVDVSSVFRDDEDRASLPPQDVMANAPRRDDDYFRVKPVLG